MTRDTCYRFRRYYLHLGVGSTAFFVAMGVGSTLAALTDIDGSFPRPELAAVIFGAGWSCFTVLGVWLIVAYVRSRLLLNKDRVRQAGCLGTREMEFAEVSLAKWRLMPQGGSLVLHSPHGKLKVEFDAFSAEDRKPIIQFLHAQLDSSVQQGWDAFERQFFPTQSAERRTRSIRVLLSFSFIIFSVIFGYVWNVGLGLQYLVLATANALLGLWSLLSTWRTRIRSGGRHNVRG